MEGRTMQKLGPAIESILTLTRLQTKWKDSSNNKNGWKRAMIMNNSTYEADKCINSKWTLILLLIVGWIDRSIKMSPVDNALILLQPNKFIETGEKL